MFRTAASFAFAVSAASAGPDLVITDAILTSTVFNAQAGVWDFNYTFTIRNIGDVEASLIDNPVPGGGGITSDAGLQNWLSTQPDGSTPRRAAAGANFQGNHPDALAPDEAWTGFFRANTSQLDDPTFNGAFTTLVIELTDTGETGNALLNNEFLLTVPSVPGAPAALVISSAGLVWARRRR